MVFGTSFLFVTAHLTAHQEKVKERVSDVKRIVNSLDLPRLLPCKNKAKGKSKKCYTVIDLLLYLKWLIYMKKMFKVPLKCFHY